MDFSYPGISSSPLTTEGFGEEYNEEVMYVNGVSPEYTRLSTVLADGGDLYGVSTVCFDKHEELIWMGNQGGHVTSYYGPTMQKYTSFQVHASEDIRAIITNEDGIFALTKSTLRHQIRRGIPRFTFKSPNMEDMQCLIALDKTRIVMGGHQNTLIDFDLTTGKEVNQHSLESPDARCAILRNHSYMLVAGDPSGRITLRDPVSLMSQHVVDTHSASLSDFDVHGNLIVTCGFSMNQGSLACDCFLLVYDIRALRPLPPLTVCCEPLLLKFLPTVSSRLAAVSAHGRVQLVDTIHNNDSRLSMFQVDTQNSQCLCFDVASTSQSFVFGDQTGHLHLFAPEQNTEPIFNGFSRATEFADTLNPPSFVSYNDENFSPSTIPLPRVASGSKYLSQWPEEFNKLVYRILKPVDPKVLKSMKMKGPIGYAPNPRTHLRNEMPYTYDIPSSPGHSKKTHENNASSSNLNDGDTNTFLAIPKRYRKVEIRYSKLGSTDFDFEHYNKTGLPGLEATLPNSYCNAMLQVLYYTAPIKDALSKHTCSKEFCLSCELGFLFCMLDTSSSLPCQASNFLRAFRTVPEASALGLILSDRNPEQKAKTNLAGLIQSWNRFILHQMHYEILDARKHKLANNMNNLSNHLSSMSVDYLNHQNISFQMNEEEFPVILTQELAAKKRSKKKRTITGTSSGTDQDQDRSAEDEGKYMWLSPTALAASSEFLFDTVEYEYIESGQDNEEVHYFVDEDVDDGYGEADLNLSDATNVETHNNVPDDLVNNDSEKKNNKDETEISRLFGTKQLQVHKCLKCNREEHKESIVLLCNLQYPNNIPPDPVDFTQVLRHSLCPRKTTPAWCESCNKFCPTLQCCSVRQLPHLLVINCGLVNSNDREFWRKQMEFMISATSAVVNNGTSSATFTSSSRPCRYGANCTRPGCKFKHPDEVINNKSSPSIASSPVSGASRVVQHPQHSWLPHSLIASLSPTHQLNIERMDLNGLTPKSHISVNNSTNNSLNNSSEENGFLAGNSHNEHSEQKLLENTKHYSLSAVVCHIDDVQKNIVAFIKLNTSEKTSQWFLFNDFSVSPVLSAEVCWFNLDWKTPCVLFYQSETVIHSTVGVLRTKNPTSPTIDTLTAGRVFGEDGRVAATAATVTFTPLGAHEIPKKGELVGMDAEFVTLNQEEAELRSDGRMSTIRPSHLAVARITCVRGQGSLEGTPFIDDYISTQEQVVDYLTKFSGIKPGDLDANFSSKHLTTLKSTYQKLRCLVDIGVIFVGHGLKNDFRVINLVVPSEQIIDTVQLFHLPHHRMVSLKFLAWHLLGIKIQSETHDSTEDARTALQLYKKYLELDVQGRIASTLATLYETGKRMQWKVPD